MDWRTFWNGDHAIYVNARHRMVHAELVANGIAALLPATDARVLDWGCGEAEAAPIVAARCETLYLHDGAPRVLAHLQERYASDGRVIVLDEAGVNALPPATLDVITIVSVVQYLSPETLEAVVATLVPKLAPEGRLIVADVVPPDLSPVGDAVALLTFGWRRGFLAAAYLGLLRTLFSDYRTLRSTLGLTKWREDDMLTLLSRAGLVARRAARNIGHNSARMTFVATRTG